MPRYRCPKCGEVSFSFWRKQFLGPMRKISCARCGAKVTVPWMMSTLVIVFAAVTPTFGLVAGLVASGRYGAVAGFVVFLLCALPVVAVGGWLYHRFVPLITRDA